MIPLDLNASEQNALAAACEFLSGIKYKVFTDKDLNADDLGELANVVMRFDQTNWGTLYDKLHRSGANS